MAEAAVTMNQKTNEMEGNVGGGYHVRTRHRFFFLEAPLHLLRQCP